MDNYIRKYDNVVTDDFCDGLIEKFEDHPEHIVKYGFNIKCRHVAQDTTPDPSKGGAPKEEGWVD